ncbi:hypothetical protein ACFU8W_09250 [Streptomyces sp. NPDC057565]
MAEACIVEAVRTPVGRRRKASEPSTPPTSAPMCEGGVQENVTIIERL